MSTLIVLLYILFVAAAIILTVVILLQEGKGGGFGDALGAAGQQAFGVKASGVQRFTTWVAGLPRLRGADPHPQQQAPEPARHRGWRRPVRGSAPGAGDTESGAVDHSSLLEGLTFELR